LATAFSFVAAASVAKTPQEKLIERERRRLEELLIWKMSEELKLSVEIEIPFAEAMRALNREKAKANVEVAEALSALGKAKTRGETDVALKKYEKAWKDYGELPLREVSRIRAIVGPEKLSRYLVAKSQMAEKLKALSSAAEEPTKP
jgi:hypothetical protein